MAPTDAAVLPADVPGPVAVSKGWEAQGGRGVRVDLPEPTVAAVLDATRRQLLLAELGDGRLVGDAHLRWEVAGPVASSLDRLGLHDEAERVLLTLPSQLGPRGSLPGPGGVEAPAAALAALADHVELSGDRDFAAGFLEVVAALAEGLHGLTSGRRGRATALSVGDRRRSHAAFGAAARFFEIVDEPGAAKDARGDRDRLGVDAADLRPDAPSVEGAQVDLRVWPAADGRPDLARAARFVASALDLLWYPTESGIVVAPGAAHAWNGQGWEVHDAPTPFGPLSYAVRWHGARPALLWHLEPHPGAPTARLVAPVLDPSWSTDEVRGEALLAAPPRPSGPAAAPEAGSFS
jgi:hypothetical protein